jgi:hypothetical protein
MDQDDIGMSQPRTFEIRARFNASTVRVYQAYPARIAEPALAAGRFVAPFKLSRMTWIKPSFNWMMYRSGYATKPDQEFVLGIDILREGFEWALERAVLSTFHPGAHLSPGNWKNLLHESPVRIQWDPERDWTLRSIDDVRTIHDTNRPCRRGSAPLRGRLDHQHRGSHAARAFDRGSCSQPHLSGIQAGPTRDGLSAQERADKKARPTVMMS